MKYWSTLLTVFLVTAAVQARQAPKITAAYLRTRISRIHNLDDDSVATLALLIKKLTPQAKEDLISYAHSRLNHVKNHPLKGNILIGDSHKVTQENLTQLLSALTQTPPAAASSLETK